MYTISGLFKLEWAGKGMIALNSKTYIGWGDNDGKLSTKGVSKATNQFDAEHFTTVLEDQSNVDGVNHGFRMRNGHLMQYEQQRAALTFFYPKRIVQEDGKITKPLML